MDQIDEFTKRVNSFGIDVISIGEAKTRKSYNGYLETYVTISTRKRGEYVTKSGTTRRQRKTKFDLVFKSTKLKKCQCCNRYVREIMHQSRIPWFKRTLSQMKRSEIKKENARLGTNGYACLECTKKHYNATRIEFNYSRVKNAILELKREIKCRSKQPET